MGEHMIDGFHLLRPDLLWALLACPLVALALWYRRVHQGDWTKVIDAELLPTYCRISAVKRSARASGYRPFCWHS